MQGYRRPVLLSLVLIAMLALVGVSGGLAAPSPFVGLWEGVDIDGSNLRLAIGGGGGGFRTFYFDDGATICGLDPDTGDFLYAAIARGPATASGLTLTATWDVWCLSHPAAFWGTVGVDFTYDPVADTLTDTLGVVWTR
jgi:hypothetical protein